MQKGIIRGWLFLLVCSFLSARLEAAPAGTLDTNFGNNGVLKTSGATHIAIAPDKTFFLGGYGFISRYQSNGSPDTSFGVNGVLTIQNFVVTAMGTQGDANNPMLIVAGFHFQKNGGSIPPLPEMRRYQGDGSLDTSFGANGIFPLETTLDEMAIDPMGNITGSVGLTLLQLTPDGKFINFAVSLAPAGPNFYFAHGLHILKDGKIVVVAEASSPAIDDGKYRIALARYNSDGTLDGTFQNGIKSGDPFSAKYNGYYMGFIVEDGEIQSWDQKILVGGTYYCVPQQANDPANPDGKDCAYIARFNADGSLDGTFASNGLLTFNDVTHTDAILAQDQGVLLGGGPQANLLEGFNNSGVLDTSYGSSGQASPAPGGAILKMATDMYDRTLALVDGVGVVCYVGKNTPVGLSAIIKLPIPSPIKLKPTINKLNPDMYKNLRVKP